MGMRTREYWVSTYVFGYLLYLIIAGIIVIFCLAFRFTVFTASSKYEKEIDVKEGEMEGNIEFRKEPSILKVICSPSTYLLIFFLYGHAQVSFTMLLSCFFWKPIPALNILIFTFLLLECYFFFFFFFYTYIFFFF